MPQSLPFFILDSFTDTAFAGNPAGVIFHDGSLTGDLMQRIAGELHLESAFLTPAPTSDGDYAVAFYTGAKRIPLCGHATIAAATALVHSDRFAPPGRLRFVTDVGPLEVLVPEAGDITMSQALPTYGSTVPAPPIAAALSLSVADIEDINLTAQIVSTGTPFLLVPVTRREVLNSLRPDMAKLGAFLGDLPQPADGLYAWTRETVHADAAVHARCFCPTAGLPEDPVTGTASGALGAYIARHRLPPVYKDGGFTFQTEQGYAMGRPGSAQVMIELAEERVTGVRVRGRAVLVAEGTLRA